MNTMPKVLVREKRSCSICYCIKAPLNYDKNSSKLMRLKEQKQIFCILKTIKLSAIFAMVQTKFNDNETTVQNYLSTENTLAYCQQ